MTQTKPKLSEFIERLILARMEYRFSDTIQGENAIKWKKMIEDIKQQIDKLVESN